MLKTAMNAMIAFNTMAFSPKITLIIARPILAQIKSTFLNVKSQTIVDQKGLGGFLGQGKYFGFISNRLKRDQTLSKLKDPHLIKT